MLRQNRYKNENRNVIDDPMKTKMRLPASVVCFELSYGHGAVGAIILFVPSQIYINHTLNKNFKLSTKKYCFIIENSPFA